MKLVSRRDGTLRNPAHKVRFVVEMLLQVEPRQAQLGLLQVVPNLNPLLTTIESPSEPLVLSGPCQSGRNTFSWVLGVDVPKADPPGLIKVNLIDAPQCRPTSLPNPTSCLSGG